MWSGAESMAVSPPDDEVLAQSIDRIVQLGVAQGLSYLRRMRASQMLQESKLKFLCNGPGSDYFAWRMYCTRVKMSAEEEQDRIFKQLSLDRGQYASKPKLTQSLNKFILHNGGSISSAGDVIVQSWPILVSRVCSTADNNYQIRESVDNKIAEQVEQSPRNALKGSSRKEDVQNAQLMAQASRAAKTAQAAMFQASDSVRTVITKNYGTNEQNNPSLSSGEKASILCMVVIERWEMAQPGSAGRIALVMLLAVIFQGGCTDEERKAEDESKQRSRNMSKCLLRDIIQELERELNWYSKVIIGERIYCR
ncbi:MAG: hypothetical protein EZS28_007456 [Streblomastix strix]|uniref:SURP motif domain-containing protein n=1 Tax=Streblomastix strix TaxID=222440 RepID=A0A5J4WRJ5_9EUKA|nr:MAG: hypothetical protein EZS28_007456 [Streblomastix strix]